MDNVVRPTPRQMAANAILVDHPRREWYVPQVTWKKDYPGQVTDGRIGRPGISFCPVSWLSAPVRKEVLALIRAGEAGRFDAP